MPDTTARSLVGWSQDEVAHKAGLTKLTVSAFERGGAMRINNNDKLQEALEVAGVVFIEDGENSKTGGAVAMPPVGLCPYKLKFMIARCDK
ncbi:MAG: helix-turn-helix domain-containing protein [Hyphomicrobiales bacterium]